MDVEKGGTDSLGLGNLERFQIQLETADLTRLRI